MVLNTCSGDARKTDLPGRGGVLPALLDRLSVKDYAAGLSRQDYQRILVRDLEWLLNCTAPMEVALMQRYPHVADSVLNYGMRAFSGLTLGELDLGAAASHISKVIEVFEPRLVPESIQVLADDRRKFAKGQVGFSIRAQFWYAPFPLQLAIFALWDLETGLLGVESA